MPARGIQPPPRRQLPHRLRIWIPSTRAALNRAVSQARGLARRCGCSSSFLEDLEIALREALANAIEHGSGANGQRKRVFFRCYGGPDAGMLIVVRDQGSGFDPDQVPDPRAVERLHLSHGRGLLLMRELMDCVEHRKGGREVAMYRSKHTA